MLSGKISHNYVSEATNRLNKQLSTTFTATQVRDKWKQLVRKGVVRAICVGATTRAPPSQRVTNPAASKRARWTAADDEMLTKVMRGRRGLLNGSITSNVYVQAAERLEGRLSSPRNHQQISNRWRRINEMAHGRARASEMTPAQRVRWRKAVKLARASGQVPQFTTV